MNIAFRQVIFKVIYIYWKFGIKFMKDIQVEE